MGREVDPTVSVVIPAYGHRDFIARTLESVFAQTWTDYEIIVVNDGSPDDTEAVLQPWIAREALRYVVQQNAGVAAARNRGIDLARGEFIALLDDDDLWPRDKLASQVEQLRAHPAAVMVYGNLTYIDSTDMPYALLDTEGKPLRLHCDGPDNPGPSGQVFEAFTDDNWIISPGQTLIRRAALTQMGEPPFDPTIWGADDWDLWLRLADRGEFIYSPELALRYRFHARNASQNAIRLSANCLKLLRKHRKRQRNCPQRFRLLTAKYAERLDQTYIHFYHLAWQDNQRGEFRSSLKKLRFLAGINPRCCLIPQFRQLFGDNVRQILLHARGQARRV